MKPVARASAIRRMILIPARLTMHAKQSVLTVKHQNAFIIPTINVRQIMLILKEPMRERMEKQIVQLLKKHREEERITSTIFSST